MTRVPATFEAFSDPKQFESYTCLQQGGALHRGDDGQLRWNWRTNAPPLAPGAQAGLISTGKMNADESPFNLRDRDTGKAIMAHGGSVYWNEFRERFVMIFVEIYGKQSMLGEVWFAESDSPIGPWHYAVKVASHEKYSFYNPKQHPMFDQQGGKLIYFEGTYTHTFSGNNDVTPRYDYNQLMYRLDLSDPRLALPRPVPGTDYFALDRAIQGAIPIPGQDKPAYYMLPDSKNAPAATVPLYSFEKNREKRYATAEKMEGFERSEKPVGRVWK
jgi:hypothetical protein